MSDLTGRKLCAFAGVLGAGAVSFGGMLQSPAPPAFEMESVLTQGASDTIPRPSVLMPELRFALDFCDLFATEIVGVPATLADVEHDLLQDEEEQSFDDTEIESGFETLTDDLGSPSLGFQF